LLIEKIVCSKIDREFRINVNPNPKIIVFPRC